MSDWRDEHDERIQEDFRAYLAAFRSWRHLAQLVEFQRAHGPDDPPLLARREHWRDERQDACARARARLRAELAVAENVADWAWLGVTAGTDSAGGEEGT